jgi:hypothetical protein
VRLFDSEQRHSRESSVQEKAAKFDTLAFQGKALERRANDAALKRAMLGREEAETDMRRYRDEARQLRKDVQEGKDRERKVGERLESMMVCFYHFITHAQAILTTTPGKLWQGKGNIRAYPSLVGERNPPCPQRHL